MIETKCPICGEMLQKYGEVDPDTGTSIVLGAYCRKCDIGDSDIKLWQELDRTRKALDVAIKYIKHTQKVSPFWFNRLATKTLEQIKTLEQKESAFVHNKIKFPEYDDNLLEEFDKQFFENGQDDDLTETALEQKEG